MSFCLRSMSVLVVLSAGPMSLANTVTTIGAVTGTTAMGGVSNNVSSIGQIFSVPSGDNYLNRFSFLASFLNVNTGTATQSPTFTARIMEWNPSTQRATGPTLFTSNPLSSTTSFTDTTQMQRFDIPIPSLSVSATSQYVAVITFFGQDNSSVPNTRLLLGRGSGSGLTRIGVASVPNPETFASAWSSVTGGLSSELDFSQNPVAVPAPLGAAMTVVGLGLVGIRRRRTI